MTLFRLHAVGSFQNRETPIYFNPYYWDPEKGAPDFGKPPVGGGGRIEILLRQRGLHFDLGVRA